MPNTVAVAAENFIVPPFPVFLVFFLMLLLESLIQQGKYMTEIGRNILDA
jgi:hypothetical protein